VVVKGGISRKKEREKRHVNPTNVRGRPGRSEKRESRGHGTRKRGEVIVCKNEEREGRKFCQEKGGGRDVKKEGGQGDRKEIPRKDGLGGGSTKMEGNSAAIAKRKNGASATRLYGNREKNTTGKKGKVWRSSKKAKTV